MENPTQDNSTKTRAEVNWRLIGELASGCRKELLLGTLSVLLGILASYAIPFITSFTLDFVIKGDSSGLRLPTSVLQALDALGGREYFLSHLYLCALLLVVFTMLNGLFMYLRRREIAFASENVTKQLRDRLYRHLEDVPYDYHKHVSTGDLIQRCTSDVNTIRRFISMQLMEVVRTILMIVIAVIVMFSIHKTMALISMAMMPLLTLSSFIYFRAVRRYFTESDEAEGKLSTMLQENLTGIRVVRAFGQQRKELERFTKLNEDFRDKTYRLIRLLGYYWGVSDCAGYLQIGLSLVAGVLFVVKGEFTLGNVTLFATYTGMLTWPVRQLGRILADMGKASVSLARIDEILSAPVEKEPGKALCPDINGDIVFENVCFGYDRYDDVLKNISFTVHPGETIGILGSTGSGKSSLVQLLQRLYETTSGRILINGTNINDIEHGHLRHNIGIVLQEPFLYSRTILENIRIVNPDATLDEVHAVARIASVHDVIESFENGYDTIVGERGITLSGGQQQRVAIARTLMQKAPILIFDDSMSAVDTETDSAIRRALHEMRHDGITFLISHRITTLCEADRILVLDGGRLIEEGTHKELMAGSGLYSRIAAIQDMQAEGGDER